MNNIPQVETMPLAGAVLKYFKWQFKEPGSYTIEDCPFDSNKTTIEYEGNWEVGCWDDNPGGDYEEWVTVGSGRTKKKAINDAIAKECTMPKNPCPYVAEMIPKHLARIRAICGDKEKP